MIESSVAIFTLTLIRTATLIAVIPLFGGRNLPNLVKVGLAVALAGTLYAAEGASTADSLKMLSSHARTSVRATSLRPRRWLRGWAGRGACSAGARGRAPSPRSRPS